MTSTRLRQTTSTPGAATAPPPPGTEVAAGPWSITVLEVLTGDEAAAAIAAAHAENPGPPDSLQPLLVRISVRNGADRPRAILRSDFAATGSDGVLRRSPTIVVPEPELGAVVEPGATEEGWLPFYVDDPSNAVLTFDSVALGGTRASATLGLTDGGAMPEVFGGDIEESDAGADPDAPAAIGDAVRTGGFEVVVQEVITGQDVFDRSDFRLQALSPGYSPIGLAGGGMANLVALYATVTNVSPYPAFFSHAAFAIADPSGEPWDHTLTMTGPEPVVHREYLPGASGEGWATYEYPGYGSLDLIRVLPFPVGGSPRFIAFTGGGASSAPSEAADDAVTAPSAFAQGDAVETTEDRVNLRTAPSASAEIVTELPAGTVLTITGDSEEADGYVWWPVAVDTSGEAGYVVADYLAPQGEE